MKGRSAACRWWMLAALLSAWAACGQQQPPEPAPEKKEALSAPGPDTSAEPSDTNKRIALNLLGQVDTGSGESRRNENVRFNLIDNNALKDLNVRLGATATIVEVFRADRGYFGAEFGTPPAMPLHVPPAKFSGLHGSAYEMHGNSVLSARSFFQAGGVKPAHENRYGFQLAAPLWRGAVLTLDGSQQKIRGSVNGNVLVPKADERTPLGTDPATRAVVARFLAAYPADLPNRPDIDPRALNINSPQHIDGNDAQMRLDQRRGQRDRITFQYHFTSQHVEAFQLVAGQNPNTDTKSHVARVTWDHQWAPDTVTNFSIGFDRLRSVIVPEPHAVGPLVLTASVIEQLGPEEILPINRAENHYRQAGAVHHVRGQHFWIAGFETLRRQVNGSEQNSHRGIVFFDNDFGRDALTNIRLGTPSRYTLAMGNIHRGFRSWDLQFYAGDSWRIRPRLSLEYSLRYQPAPAPHEVNNLSNIPYGCDCNNLAPRLGFAYNLPGRWGVLRSAYGLQYGEIFAVTYQQVRFNPPENITVVITAPYLPNPLRDLKPQDLAPDARTNYRLISPNLVVPYSHQYNFSWEPEIAKNWKLQLGYVGSRTHKLLMLWYQNRGLSVPGIDLITDTINDRRRNPRYFDVYHILNASRAYYDAGKATLIVPRWHGLSADASYWFSKAIDLGSNYTNTAYEKDGRLSRSQAESPVTQDMKGLSGFDQTHSVILHLTYAVPALADRGWRRAAGQWTFSTVYLHKTGTPFEINTGSDAPGFGNVDGQNGDRPNILDPSILGRSIHHPDTSTKRLPRSAFGFIAPGQSRGSLGHHVFRKGGVANVNASLSRAWSLGSEKTLTFRAESINFFNTPQFAEPIKDLTAPAFGQITNTLNDGRTFRFQLRFAF